MSHYQKNHQGLTRIFKAVGYSASGLKMAYRDEGAFRQETWLGLVLVPAAFWVGRDWPEVALLAGSVMLVLIIELLNSAVEAAIDRIGFELHDLSRRAKDFGSAAVFLSVIVSFGIWSAAIWTRLNG